LCRSVLATEAAILLGMGTEVDLSEEMCLVDGGREDFDTLASEGLMDGVDVSLASGFLGAAVWALGKVVLLVSAQVIRRSR